MCPILTAPAWVADDRCNASLHAGIAGVAKVSFALTSGARDISIAVLLWSVDRQLKAFLRALYPQQSSDAELKHVLPEQVEEVIHSLRELHKLIERVYENAKLRGLTNRRLTSASLRSIHASSDEVLDVAEILELMLDPRTAEVITKARGEFVRGETVSLESLL